MGYRHAAFSAFGQRVLTLDHLFVSPQPGRWNWKNSDLALAQWFRSVGRTIDFDILHFLEWDLLMLDSLERLYAHVPPQAVGLTTVTPLSEVETAWEWLQRPGDRDEWERLLVHARREWGYDLDPVACVAGGACFPRSFVEQYAMVPPPALSHDELRLPLFAQAHGFPIVDTGFRNGWQNTEEDRFFNLLGEKVERETILAELSNAEGRRVFHPVTVTWRPPRQI